MAVRGKQCHAHGDVRGDVGCGLSAESSDEDGGARHPRCHAAARIGLHVEMASSPGKKAGSEANFAQHVIWVRGKPIQVTVPGAPVWSTLASTAGMTDSMSDLEPRFHPRQKATPDRASSDGDREEGSRAVAEEKAATSPPEMSPQDPAAPAEALPPPPAPRAQRPGKAPDQQRSKLAPFGCPVHGVGACRPCFYANTDAGCHFGSSCTFCHELRPKPKKPRPSKHARHEWQEAAKVVFNTVQGATLPQAEALLLQQSQTESMDDTCYWYGCAVLKALYRGKGEAAGAAPSSSSRLEGRAAAP